MPCSFNILSNAVQMKKQAKFKFLNMMKTILIVQDKEKLQPNSEYHYISVQGHTYTEKELQCGICDIEEIDLNKLTWS